MAAGLSRQQRTRYAYNELQAIRRKLARAGVNTNYVKGSARTRGHLVYTFDGYAVTPEVDGGFNISIEWGSMSSGETVGTFRIYLVLKGESKVYAGMGGGRYAGSFSQGLDIIKREFKGAL